MTRFFALAIALTLFAAACGGDDDGDLAAYRDLVRSGVGSEVDGNTEGFAELVEVSPPEAREAVEQLNNTAVDLSEIEELHQLFAAAFDPDAQQARLDFAAHAVSACGVDAALLGAGSPLPNDDQTDRLAALDDYIETNFADAEWAGKVRYEFSEDPTMFTVTFAIRADDGEPLDACTALGIWWFSVEGEDGPLEIVDDQLVAAGRTDQSSSCVDS